MDGNRLVSRVWGAECHGKRAPAGQRQNYQKIEGTNGSAYKCFTRLTYESMILSIFDWVMK
jgi:hypothetical protein